MKHLRNLLSKKTFFHPLHNEVFLYLIFGVATTLVYIATRTSLFALLSSTLVVVFLANCVSITFAFFTNDRIVFRQKAAGWPARMVKFVSARISTLLLDMLLAYLFIDAFPHIIGQFVQDDPRSINMVVTLITQVLVVVANYVLSKLFIFTNNSKDS